MRRPDRLALAAGRRGLVEQRHDHRLRAARPRPSRRTTETSAAAPWSPAGTAVAAPRDGERGGRSPPMPEGFTSTGSEAHGKRGRAAKVDMIAPMVAAARPMRAPYSGNQEGIEVPAHGEQAAHEEGAAQPGDAQQVEYGTAAGSARAALGQRQRLLAQQEQRLGRPTGMRRARGKRARGRGDRWRCRPPAATELEIEKPIASSEVHRALLGRAVRPEHAVHGDVHVQKAVPIKRAREVEGLEVGQQEGQRRAAASAARRGASGARGPDPVDEPPGAHREELGSSANRPSAPRRWPRWRLAAARTRVVVISRRRTQVAERGSA